MEKNAEFLRLVARAFVENEARSYMAQPFGDTVFVFPNRRSMKFFQKYLGEEFGRIYAKPLFSPQMLTISELFGNLCTLKPVDNIEAQYVLYRNYIALKETAKTDNRAAETTESFDEFIHWGSIILADFNDIDKYLIDARQLFTNIKDLKQLDSDYSFLSTEQHKAVEKFWSSFLGGGGSFNFKKESFSSLWNIMYSLYKNFRDALQGRGLGYEGMIYRNVAENPHVCEDKFGKLVFIGFNAPNRCEKALMKWLKERGRADFYWDFYGPMVTDKENKASMFISEAVREFPSKYRIECKIEMPDFNVIGVPSGVGQAFVAAEILKKNSDNGSDPIKTAVILPDETLLMPVLDSIPDSYSKINVTMGFPISATPLMSFMNAVTAFQKDVKVKGGRRCFYHGTTCELLRHEYMRGAAHQECEMLVKEIIRQNVIFIAEDNELLKNIASPLLRAIFKMPESSAQMLEYLLEILKELDSCTDTLNREFIYRYYLAIERLMRLAIPMKKETCLRLLSQITGGITIPFRGEPLAGLQVIGSLEVRALDFENIIILSVNEGRFPASSQSNSLIPYNLRIGFGLPTYELQDAIAAYHFYRSVCRAKNVWLVYDTRTEGLKSGEESRFIKQLEYHYNIPLKKSVVSAVPVIDEVGTAISVQKTGPIMQKLYDAFDAEYGKKVLSASAINNYLACPLQFYLQYVEGIRESDEVEESVEASTFGTIFHDCMEEIYSKYKGEIVSAEILDGIIGNDALIERIIKDKFFKNKILEIEGRNVIIKEVIKKYILITIEYDKKYAPFEYVGGEETFYHKLELPNGRKVKFMAVIDRIDKTGREGETLRVIDYKTGRVEVPNSDSDIEDLFDRESEKQYKAFVQLYLYALVLAENAGADKFLELKDGRKVKLSFTEDSSDFEVAVYPVTALKKDSVISEQVYSGNLATYKRCLTECVTEIFNSDIPFYQADEQSTACGYCMFKQICGR